MSADSIASTTNGLFVGSDTQINFDFKNEFVPTQGSPLKKLIGNYTGKIHFGNNYRSNYNVPIPNTYTHTMALIKKYGWIK